MKLNSGVFATLLVVLAGLSAGSAQATGVKIKAPDPGCENIGVISTPLITIGGAPGDCTDFTWGPATPTSFLGVIVTDVQPPLTCEVEGSSFNTCSVIFADITATLNPTEDLILDLAISLIPGLTQSQVSELDAAVLDLQQGDGLLLASCDPKLSACTDFVQGETGGVSTPEPSELLLLGFGLSLVGIIGWKHGKLTASRRFVS
jgi:hypothetical protein